MRRLTALSIAGGLAVGGCGGGSSGTGAGATRTAPPGTAQVTLALVHSTGDEQLLACSLVHHYKVYRRVAVAYTGTLHPAPAHHWNVKVKIKRCVDGQFQDSVSVHSTGSANGRFAGSLQAPGKGVFFARARFRSPQGDVLSDKVYFEVK
jgi:hypothetical protein